MYDLMVVGGGPAGSTCAREAARKGLDVVLIEKEEVPRDKLCGGALSPRIINTLDFDISSVVQHDMHCAIVYAPSGRKIVIVRDDAKGFLVKRDEFDTLLLDKARDAGVEVVDGTEIKSVEQIRKGIRILSHGDSFKGHLLVGADGVNSVVARSLGMRTKWPPERVALCIAADIPLPPDEIQRILAPDESQGNLAIEMYPWAIEYGYGWCFPKRDEISLGIGYKMKHQISNLRDAWKGFVRRFEEEKDIKLDIPKHSAHRVPLARFDKRLTTRRTMLIGDAAGLVSPITGEGIYYAIRSGIIAGQVAFEAVQDKNPLHVALYDHRLKHEMKTEFNAANFVSNLAYKSREKVELVCELAENDPILQDYMIDLALGARSINKIRFDITKRMLRHYPLKSLRLLR
ncbi:MAG: geranylgeranyl reductase family protein [Candidatus Thorarchaeota archaeon]